MHLAGIDRGLPEEILSLGKLGSQFCILSLTLRNLGGVAGDICEAVVDVSGYF